MTVSESPKRTLRIEEDCNRAKVAVRVGYHQNTSEGFKYFFDYDNEASTPNDFCYQSHGVEIRIERSQIVTLTGIEISWIDNSKEAGFKFTKSSNVHEGAPVTLSENAAQIINEFIQNPADPHETYVYDKAKWHLHESRKAKSAYVHTGLFLAWLIERNLISDEFANDLNREMTLLTKRKITGPELFVILGGIFAKDMLNDEGNKFSLEYYDTENGGYLGDYKEVLCRNLEDMYDVQDSWANYDILRQRLDKRFEAWHSKSTQ